MPININLFDTWKLRSDKHNIILVKEEAGREVDTWFYPDIPSALEGFINKKIKQFDSTSIFGLIQAIKQLETRLNTLLQPLKLKVVSLERQEQL